MTPTPANPLLDMLNMLRDEIDQIRKHAADMQQEIWELQTKTRMLNRIGGTL